MRVEIMLIILKWTLFVSDIIGVIFLNSSDEWSNSSSAVKAKKSGTLLPHPQGRHWYPSPEYMGAGKNNYMNRGDTNPYDMHPNPKNLRPNQQYVVGNVINILHYKYIMCPPPVAQGSMIIVPFSFDVIRIGRYCRMHLMVGVLDIMEERNPRKNRDL